MFSSFVVITYDVIWINIILHKDRVSIVPCCGYLFVCEDSTQRESFGVVLKVCLPPSLECIVIKGGVVFLYVSV